MAVHLKPLWHRVGQQLGTARIIPFAISFGRVRRTKQKGFVFGLPAQFILLDIVKKTKRRIIAPHPMC